MTTVQRKWSSDSSAVSRPDGQTGLQRTASEVWQVDWDTAELADTSDPLSVSGLPTIDSHFETHRQWGNGLRCWRIGPAKRVGPMAHDVPVEYRGATEDGPWTEPAKLSTRSRKTMIQVDRDTAGLPIQTLSGEMPNPRLQAPISDIAITISQAKQSLPGGNLFEVCKYANKLNSLQFLSFLPRTVYCEDVAVTEALAGGIKYYDLTATFLARVYLPGIPQPTIDDWNHAWSIQTWQQGYYERNAEGLIVPILDDQDEPVVSPRTLDANGQYTPTPTIDDVWYIPIFYTADFNGFGFTF